MRCIVCNGDKWTNVDQFRIKPSGMHQCDSCGFVSYPEKYKSYEEIRDYYRASYRQAPNISNLTSGERKLWYHERVLRPLIEEWKKAGLKPVVGEIGSAMGMFLKWMTEQIDCEVHGTEWTTSYRRVAYHEFGIKLDEEFDFSRKYDLIASYHVLEHQQDADEWLKKYLDCLSPNGVMYLSTPIWFRELANFGAQGFDIEYYWHPDHINAWSEEHLEHIIARAGASILFKNTDIYGNTYLLKAGPKEVTTTATREWNNGKYRGDLEKIFTCWKLIQENKTAAAIEAWPNCITAWINHFELHRTQFNKDKPEMNRFLNQMVHACPNSSDAYTMAADVAARYEDYDGAYDLFSKAAVKKPNNPTLLMGMANARRQKALRTKDPKEKVSLLTESLEISRAIRASSIEMANQITTWIYHDEALLPMEGE